VVTLCLLALLTPALWAQGPQWKIQYFYDKLHETLDIEDLAFPSAQRGIAMGTIVDPAKKPVYILLVTGDGGESWKQVPVKDRPRSIFFLNETVGWMVTDDAIWSTEESGLSWKKVGEQKKPDKKILPVPPGGLISRVWFLDAQHGFAAGYQKSAFETQDGGKTWTPIAAAAEPSANPAHAAYTQISFDGPNNGLMVGGSTPPRADDPHLPSWMEPERATKRRQVPTLTLLVETRDGGKTWRSSTAPLFGSVISLHLTGTSGLAVFSFNESFEWPSEVYRMDLATGKSERVFREKDRRVTDAALYAGPRAFLAAVEPPGRLSTSPIPGKVKMLTSSDLNEWTEMKVDYKANARAVILAGPDAAHQWAATDTGMILRLVQ
jgi:hypothetical protein